MNFKAFVAVFSVKFVDVVSVCSISKQSVKVFSVKIVFSTNP